MPLPLPDQFSAWLAEHLGAELVARAPVGGGCIHSAWCLRLADGGRLFAKTGRREALPLLEAEAEGLGGLRAVADPAQLVVPEPLALGLAGEQAVLVLPWLELRPSSPGAWRRLGAGLADLHRQSLAAVTARDDRPGRFGWERDNFIGSGAQGNGWFELWGPFFASRRLAPQLERLAAKGHSLRGAGDLLERVPAWLGSHGPEPCLVHGDLWSGNASPLADGRGALFDPAAYRGDREVDLAMARLFGGFPGEFFAAYEERWPLPAGHHTRVDLYNLYHLLNHANLFGGGYHRQAQSSIDHLLRTMPG